MDGAKLPLAEAVQARCVTPCSQPHLKCPNQATHRPGSDLSRASPGAFGAGLGTKSRAIARDLTGLGDLVPQHKMVLGTRPSVNNGDFPRLGTSRDLGTVQNCTSTWCCVSTKYVYGRRGEVFKRLGSDSHVRELLLICITHKQRVEVQDLSGLETKTLSSVRDLGLGLEQQLGT